MPQYGTWTPYAAAEALRLALILLVIAGALAFLAFRLHQPLRPRTTGPFAGGVLAAIWLVACVTFLVDALTYFEELVRAAGQFTPPPSPIAPITALSGLLGFIAIMLLARHSGWKAALGGAVLGMLAAPMIFELPFDLIVMSRLYPTPPPPAVQYVLLYFLPLFLITLSSIGLLTVTPLARLTRASLFCLSALFLVFAAWASLGFPYPSGPLPLALNATAKVVAFAAAVALFIP